MENKDYLARDSLSKPRRSARQPGSRRFGSPEAPPPEAGVTAAGAEFAEIPGSRPRSVRVRRRRGADPVDARAAMDEPAREDRGVRDLLRRSDDGSVVPVKPTAIRDSLVGSNGRAVLELRSRR